MAETSMLDLHSNNGEVWALGWRCMACGEIIDSTIVANRQWPARSTVNRSRQKVGPIILQ